MSYIQQINKKLIAKYPTIWNTKIVWMTIITLLIHFIYFGLGCLRFIMPNSLVDHSYNYYSSDAGEFSFPLNYIVMLLMLVIWLSQLLKNNAFKNIYPQRNSQITSSYLQYIIIIFLIISTPLSYQIGYKTMLNASYPQATMKEYKDIDSKAQVFKISNANDYLPENRLYPSPFDTLLHVTGSDIDPKYPIIELQRNKLQYFTAVKKLYKNDYSVALEEIKNKAFSTQDKDSFVEVTNMGTFVDLSNKVINEYSLYNFTSSVNTYEYFTHKEHYDVNKKRKNYNKYVNELLDRNDAKEIEGILSNYIQLANHFKIDHNLTSDRWMQLVYHPPHFIVDTFIRTELYYNENRNEIEDISSSYASATIAADVAVDSDDENYIYTLKRLSQDSVYLNTSNLTQTLKTLEQLKSWKNTPNIALVYICVAIALAQLLFAFRATSPKMFLFGIIIGAFIILGLAFITFLVGGFDGGLFIMYATLFALVIVYLISNSKTFILKKNIIGACVAIGISCIPLLWVVIRLIIQEHINLNMRIKYGEDYYKYPAPLENLGNWNAIIIILLTLLGTYIYIRTVKRFKALPEG